MTFEQFQDKLSTYADELIAFSKLDEFNQEERCGF
jgi:hypothetical protein